MEAINDTGAWDSKIDESMRYLVQIFRRIRGRFANATPTKVPSNMFMFGIVR